MSPATARTTRPAVREVAARTEPVREAINPKKRTRKGGGTDQLHIPRDLIPDGIDLQWNVDTILGSPDVHARSEMEAQGWEPVTVGSFNGRFDHLMPKGFKGEITYRGLRLDWRPMELTMEARGEENQAARNAVRVQERKLTGGELDGVTLDTAHPTARAKTFITKERIPSMPVPK